jgi:HEAT repeat protein
MPDSETNPSIDEPGLEELEACSQLIRAIRSDDKDTRYRAWQKADAVGAIAVQPLAANLEDDTLEIARAAKKALWKITSSVSAPGKEPERKEVCAALGELLGSEQPDVVRREVLWMLSEIGDDQAVSVIRQMPDLLDQPRLREDARCALERIPTKYALQTFWDALDAAPEDFKPAIAQSLRARGETVDGFPCQKLVPTKSTRVQPLPPTE